VPALLIVLPRIKLKLRQRSAVRLVWPGRARRTGLRQPLMVVVVVDAGTTGNISAGRGRPAWVAV
jgi:hypothetical protein